MVTPKVRIGIKLFDVRNQFHERIINQYPAIKHKTQSDDILAQMIQENIMALNPQITMNKPKIGKRQYSEFIVRI